MEYEKLTVAKLRDILKERGIASTGLSRKAQIIEKLREVDAEAESAAKPAEENVEEENAEVEVESEVPAEAVQAPEVDKPESVVEEIALAEAQAAPENPTEVNQEQSEEQSKEPSAPIQDAAYIETQQSVEPTQTQPVPTTEVDQNVQPPIITTQASGTDTAVSTQPNSDIESSRKRKRRSASPPPDTQDLDKKARMLERVVHLQEDDKSTQQLSSLQNETMEVSKHHHEASHDVDKQAEQQDVEMEVEAHIETALHPPTRALYIRNFSRPLQTPALRRHLASLASSDPNDNTIQTLHLDFIRTHAFVVFDKIASAQRARAGIHRKVWPDEKGRKELWADFIPENKIQDWIKEEDQARGGSMTRWEVTYTTLENGDVEVELREEGSSAGRTSSKKFGAKDSSVVPVSMSDRYEPAPVSKPQASKAQEPNPESFATLDTLFKSTSVTKPMLYFLPVSSNLANSRLDEFRACTSKNWPPTGAGRPDQAPTRIAARNISDDDSGEGELRRYTFEERDKLVDGGVHRFGPRAREAAKGRSEGGEGGGFVPRGPRGGPRGGRRFGGGGGASGRRFGGGWRP